jgi:hypothetical protein
MNRPLDRDSVGVVIHASPEEVYALVSDITRMGEWSPECRRCEWVDGATGPRIGAKFVARNRATRGPSWSNKPVVIAADPGREFAFDRKGLGVGEVIWRYSLEEMAEGTTLKESYEVVRRPNPIVGWAIRRSIGTHDRQADLRNGMQTTLERIKAAAEGTRTP